MWSDIIPAVTCDKLMAGWHVSCWSTAQSWGNQVVTSYINDYCSISHRIWEWFCLAVFCYGFIMNLNSLLGAEATKWRHHTSMTTAVYAIEYENDFVGLCLVVVISIWMDLCVFLPMPPLASSLTPRRSFDYPSVNKETLNYFNKIVPWWRHQMEKFSALLALSAGNSLVTGEFPTQRPVMRSFDVFFDLHLNKRVNNREADESRHHHGHYDVTVITNTQQNIYCGYDR